jgi:hypothetical protein
MSPPKVVAKKRRGGLSPKERRELKRLLRKLSDDLSRQPYTGGRSGLVDAAIILRDFLEARSR